MYKKIHTVYEHFVGPICNFFFTQSGVLKSHKYIYLQDTIQDTYKRHTHKWYNTSARYVTKLSWHVRTSKHILLRFTQEMNLLTAFDFSTIPSPFLSLVFEKVLLQPKLYIFLKWIFETYSYTIHKRILILNKMIYTRY